MVFEHAYGFRHATLRATADVCVLATACICARECTYTVRSMRAAADVRSCAWRARACVSNRCQCACVCSAVDMPACMRWLTCLSGVCAAPAELLGCCACGRCLTILPVVRAAPAESVPTGLSAVRAAACVKASVRRPECALEYRSRLFLRHARERACACAFRVRACAYAKGTCVRAQAQLRLRMCVGPPANIRPCARARKSRCHGSASVHAPAQTQASLARRQIDKLD